MKNTGRKLLCLLMLFSTVFLYIISGRRDLNSKYLAASADCEYVEADVDVRLRVYELLRGKETEAKASGECRDSAGRRMLLVGGFVFGTKIKESCVTVTDAEGVSGILAGDKLLSINGKTVKSVSDVKNILSASDGKELTLILQRGQNKTVSRLIPKEVAGSDSKSDNKSYKLGISIRDGAAGIGTVTYIDPTTKEFGGLGHGICDTDTGELLDMTEGVVTGVVLGGVQKGESGKPGELSGILNDKRMGEVFQNTEEGVFGSFNSIPKSATRLLPIATRGEVKAGEAKIISTLKNGRTMEYSVELFDINHSSTGTKSFKIKVTDKSLLAISGGIVRGMSGSPIIQDGKLVGAVTHVLINDPTEGYGIFIENMLNAAQSEVIPKAA